MLRIFLRSQNKSSLLCPFLPESPTCSSQPACPVAVVDPPGFPSTRSLWVSSATACLLAVTCISVPRLLVHWRASSSTWSPLIHLPFPALSIWSFFTPRYAWNHMRPASFPSVHTASFLVCMSSYHASLHCLCSQWLCCLQPSLPTPPPMLLNCYCHSRNFISLLAKPLNGHHSIKG